MDEIETKASNAPSGATKVATTEAKFSDLQTLYILVQCDPLLSGSDWNRCIWTLIGYLPSCCAGKQGGNVLNPSCFIRYEVYPFYKVPAVPSPLPTPVLLAFLPPKGMYRYIFEADAFYMIQIVKTIKCKTITEFSNLTKTVLVVLHIYNTCLSYKLQEDKVTDKRSLKYTRSISWNTKEDYLWQLFLSLAWLLSTQLFWILEFKDSSLSQLAWIHILDLLLILSLTHPLKLNCIGTTLSLE